MMSYDIVKWIHIVSATVFFATGIGTAVRMWLAYRHGDVHLIASVARKIVRVDLTLTATSGIALPITGAILVSMAGFPADAPWLIASYILYAIAFFCWTMATKLRIRVRDIAASSASQGHALPDRYYRYMRWWFQLSSPALIAFLVIIYLMMSQPLAGPLAGNGIPAL